MLRIEDKIRDYLADHLDLVERGLSLIKPEYQIENPDGAGGRIDLLAKDQFNHFVIIEIKRSDQAARQALSELHKYAALFRLRKGLSEKSIRLIVVSTEWHELLLPLAEFAHTTNYSVEGIKIVASDDGVISKRLDVDLKVPRQGLGELRISSCQGVYLFRDREKRDSFTSEFITSVTSTGVEDFIFLNCDYNGNYTGVIHPYGAYLCFSSPLGIDDRQKVASIKSKIDWEDGLEQPDENFFAAFQIPEKYPYNDFEIGYPEKLAKISNSWSVEVSTRHGRFNSKDSLFSDRELIQLAQATSGGSSVYFSKVSSPKFKASWKDFRQNLKQTLNGYPLWANLTKCLLRKVKSNSVEATVTVNSYGPGDFLLSLYAMHVRGDFKYLPSIEIIIEDLGRNEVRVIYGVITWNGTVIEKTPAEVIQETFNDVQGWMAANQFGGTFESESDVISSHNLKLSVAEWTFKGKLEPVLQKLGMRKGSLKRSPWDAKKMQPISSFLDAHSDYLDQLVIELDKYSCGLRESICADQANRQTE